MENQAPGWIVVYRKRAKTGLDLFMEISAAISVLVLLAVYSAALAKPFEKVRNRLIERFLSGGESAARAVPPPGRDDTWDRALAILLVLTAIGILMYWTDYWTYGTVNATKADWYLKFESSFVVADCWVALCCVLGAYGLVRARRAGVFFSLLAGGCLVFLGLIDITFNIQNDMYDMTNRSEAMQIELFINLWTLGFAALLLARLYYKMADPDATSSPALAHGLRADHGTGIDRGGAAAEPVNPDPDAVR
jgi:hypothetical protein